MCRQIHDMNSLCNQYVKIKILDMTKFPGQWTPTRRVQEKQASDDQEIGSSISKRNKEATSMPHNLCRRTLQAERTLVLKI